MLATVVENGRRRKTHCKHGHAFDGTETWATNWKGYQCRVCRECARIRAQRRRANPAFRANEAAKMRRWRENNPETNRKRWQEAGLVRRQMLLDARVDGCIRCGEQDPACLDFHHRNGKTDKEGHISVMRNYGLTRLKAELAKCDVLCANCHRKHHRDERERKLAS